MSRHGAKKSVERSSSWILLLINPVPSQREGGSTEECEIGGGIPVSDPAFVFLETRTVKTLVGAVLDIPVLAFPPQQLFGTQRGLAGKQEDDAITLGVLTRIRSLHEHRRSACIRETDLFGADIKSIDGACFDSAAVEFNALQRVHLRGEKRSFCERCVLSEDFPTAPSGSP